jgi:hypothetical protein
MTGDRRQKTEKIKLSSEFCFLVSEKKEVFNMPRGDGTGPLGQGPMTGRGMGGGRGVGRDGGGRGMGGGNRPGAGPAGNCVCPDCGTKASHQRGVACYSVSCPKCGTKMVRE